MSDPLTIASTTNPNYLDTNINDWTRSDLYHNKFLIKPDTTLDAAQENSVKNDLPDIAVSEAQGKFLNLLARTLGAKRVLEVGTLGGYSTIWLARDLPEDGKMITLEVDPKHAKVAQENLTNAGVASKVEIILGDAVDTIAKLLPEPPFDLVFIDADKQSNKQYFINAKRLVKKGGAIIVDNVVRFGRVSSPECIDERVGGVRRLLEYVSTDTEVDATTIATVGTKGYDGFMYAIKL